MVSIFNPPQKTTFEAVQIKMGPEWYVRVTLPNGEQPHLGSFKTEAKAIEWIRDKSAGWLKGYESSRFV
jgi:hypothetical protein